MSSDPHRRTRRADVLGVAALAALVVVSVLCCAAPLLIAGALATAGAWLHDPWLIAAAALGVFSALAVLIRRCFTAMRGSGVAAQPGEHCCAPGQTTAGRPTHVTDSPSQARSSE